jgi:hypothetical protein
MPVLCVCICVLCCVGINPMMTVEAIAFMLAKKLATKLQVLETELSYYVHMFHYYIIISASAGLLVLGPYRCTYARSIRTARSTRPRLSKPHCLCVSCLCVG